MSHSLAAHGRTAARPLTATLLFATLAALAACASSGGTSGSTSKSSGPLAPADFRGQAQPAKEPAKPSREAIAVQDLPPPVVAPDPAAKPLVTTTPAAASDGLRDVTVIAGAPATPPSPDARPDEAAVFVDALVGQINGKPVFANRFLTPLDARLRAALRNRPPREWAIEAARLIKDELNRQLQDELLVSEARSVLTPDERKGLVNFLTKIREGIAAERGAGSMEYADERLQSEEGRTLEEMATDERDKALIRSLIARHIQPRVNVSWRDVRRQYERDIRKYVPAPSAVFRRIEAPKADAARTDQIKADLAGGKAFAEVAGSPLNELSASAAEYRVRFEGEFAEAMLFGDAGVNEAARRLKPGEFAGPIDQKDKVVWVRFEAIDQPPGRSLAEVQLEIYNALRGQRFREESGRYFERLLAQGTKTDEREMTARLLTIAIERYLSPEQRKAALSAVAPPTPPTPAPTTPPAPAGTPAAPAPVKQP